MEGDSPCKMLEVASPEPEDGGGSLHALEWGLTYLVKRSRLLALSPRMVVEAFIPPMEDDSPCKTLEVAIPESEDGGGSLHPSNGGRLTLQNARGRYP